MRTLAVATALLLLISACTESPAVAGDRQQEPEPEPDPVQVWIDAPEEGAEVGGREVLVRARASAEAGLSEARFLVDGDERARLRLSGTTRPFSQQVKLGPGANRIVVEVDDLEGSTGSAVRTVMSRGRPPKITSLVATPNPARPGQTVELRWEIDAVGPVTMSLGDLGEVEGGSAVVLPDFTQTYLLTATSEWGTDTAEVLVTVQPELIPHVQIVAAGSVQKLRVAGLKAPGVFTTTGGTISRHEKEFDWIWQVPAEPGTYEIQVEHADGVSSHPVEVQAIERIVPRLLGVGGHPAPTASGDGGVVVDPEGRMWVITAGGVTRGRAGGDWQLVASGLWSQPLSLLLLQDGRPLARMQYRSLFGEGEEPWLVWEESSRRWIPWDDLPPIKSEGALLVGAAGWQVFLEGRDTIAPRSLWRRSPDGTWQELEGPRSRELALAGDGTVYLAHEERRGNPVELWVAPPGAPLLETTGVVLPEVPDFLHLQPDGTLLAVGEGLWQVDPVGGTIEDLAEGLGSACSRDRIVCSLLHQGDTLLALDQTGIHARTQEGWEPILEPADMPPGPRSLLSDGSGGLLLISEEGIFHLPEGESTLRPYGGEGLPGPLEVASSAIAPDGTVAVSLLPIRDPTPAIALLRPGETQWTGIGQAGFGFLPTASDLVFDGASRLLFVEAFGLKRLPAGATTWEEIEVLPAPPGTPRVWTALQDGSLIASVGGDRIHRLPLDAAEWEAMPGVMEPLAFAEGPEGVLWTVGEDGLPRRLEPGAASWEPIAPLAVHMPWGLRGTTVSIGTDGTPWTLAQFQGVQRLEDELWRPVGSGTCSMAADRLLLSKSGSAVCVGPEGVQLLQTVDGAEVWIDVETFVPGTAIDALFEGPDGHPWLATAGGGLYELQLP